ncbi:uncharacterized protein LOC141773169 isoform X3 [Sebastes fasciatus]|uniref:uncharacterized protein LOC141773169 isoform X3 n=1 Tax=Sebastes fasciatus TaxID=394691 RepID=UPI003D9E2EEC
MDVTSHYSGSDITESGANKNAIQSECISSQPTANGTLPHPNTDPLPAEEAPPPLSDRSEDGDSADDVTDSATTNDVARLLPTQHASALCKQKGVDSSSVSPPPVCTPPLPPPSRSSTCNRHSCSLPHHHHHDHHQHSTNQKRLSSTRSHASIKTDATHIKEVAGDGEPLQRRGLRITDKSSQHQLVWFLHPDDSRTLSDHQQSSSVTVCL